METGFIESHIARGNRNMLVIGLALTIIHQRAKWPAIKLREGLVTRR